MSVFRKAAVYLGLVDDEDDEVYEYEDAAPDDGGNERPLARPRATNDAAAGVVRPIREPQNSHSDPAPLRVAAGGPSGGTSVNAVRSVAPAKVHVVEPKAFNDAQEIGDRLRLSTPVIVNLQGLDRDLQRRLIDFASGLCYALGGTMSKVGDQVFLLTPPNVEVSDDEKDRLRDRGLYRR
ncbi:MAG TPA: cell division protein SepF [Acidimicrobiia bacterium]|jgi:cell division inhibitor SepF